ncbi:hypothetical protein ONZ45_g1 [Pleurotus djamor]|nr:hypothetical protein ONZ45_g1 [Pleurotus djamor]
MLFSRHVLAFVKVVEGLHEEVNQLFYLSNQISDEAQSLNLVNVMEHRRQAASRRRRDATGDERREQIMDDPQLHGVGASCEGSQVVSDDQSRDHNIMVERRSQASRADVVTLLRYPPEGALRSFGDQGSEQISRDIVHDAVASWISEIQTEGEVEDDSDAGSWHTARTSLESWMVGVGEGSDGRAASSSAASSAEQVHTGGRWFGEPPSDREIRMAEMVGGEEQRLLVATSTDVLR